MHRRYRSQRNSSITDYIMPFLILICVGVIFVLLFNLWKAVFKGEPTQGAYMHIVEGSVEMKTWGTEDFFELASDALIIQGDEVKTSADARVIFEFFDGTTMRMGGGSDVIFEEMNDHDTDPSISIFLVDGKVWFNKVYKNSGDTEILIKGNNINTISDNSSVFTVESEFDEAVRVLHGYEVMVNVLTNDDSKKVVQNEKIGVGQEIVFTDKVLDRYWKHQSPAVLSALGEEFEDSRWYAWNVAEDQRPTEFVKVDSATGNFIKVEPQVFDPVEEEETLDGEALEGEATDEEGDASADVTEKEAVEPEEEEVKEEESKVTGPLKKPTIFSVEGKKQTNAEGQYVVVSRLGTLIGGVSGAEKVIVNGYTLTKFKPGDTTWTYYANADFALMVQGENTYEVVAVAPDGTKSDPLVVKVLHDPTQAPAENTVELEVAQ